MNKFKKNVTLIICFLLCFSSLCIPSFASTAYYGSCGDNLNYAFDAGTGVLEISGTGDMWDFNSKTVRESTAEWYDYIGENSIKKIVIEDGVTSIGDWAFPHLETLEEIDIATSVQRIGKSAFWNCSNLKKVVIPKGVETIETGTFGFCSALTEISVPDSVTKIEENAFTRCSSLKNIDLPIGISVIPVDAFSFCTELTEIIIPKGVEKISYCAFYNSGLQSVTIPSTVTLIDRAAFVWYESPLENVYYNGTKAEWTQINILAENESLNNANIHYLAEQTAETTYTDRDGQEVKVNIKCESNYFVENPDKIFVAKVMTWGDEGTIVKKGITQVCKFKFYIANKNDLETKVPATSEFTLKLPIPSTHKDNTITIVHWITGKTEPEYKYCVPFWDEEQSEYCIQFETTSFSEFDICIDFGFEQDSAELFYAKTYSLPATTDENIRVTYTSSNPDVATVDESGNVTTHSKGTATITAKAEDLGDSFVDTCTVSVVNSFDIPENILDAESLELIYTHTASLSTTADETVPVTYSSSNPSVATVDENGNITTHGRGTTTITATIVDDFGEVYTDTCEVTVKFTIWQWLIYILLFGFLWY